jgi:dipeptidyl-peptidase-4
MRCYHCLFPAGPRSRAGSCATRRLALEGLALAAALLGAILPASRGAERDAPRATTDTFLRDYAQTRGYSLGRPVKAQPTPDGKAVLFLRAQARVAKLHLFEFDVASGTTRELLTPEQVLKGAQEKLSAEEKARRERMRVTVGGFADYQLSEDGSLILLSLAGKLYLVERATGRVRELLTGDGTFLDPKISPDGQSVAYVREQDVYVFDLLKDKERRVTTGGTRTVTHGLAEFVAQEEMDRFSGYWWGPDSQSIAFEEADATGVETWHVADPAHPERAPEPSFYPRPGKENVRVRLGVVSVRGGKTVWVEWDRQRYPYLAQVAWHKTGGLTLQVQTRDQKELVLLTADPKSGRTTPLLTERDAAWVNLDQQVPRWLEDGTGFLWTSEREGAHQLELRRRSGELVRVLAPPETGYQGLVTVDEGSGQVYFRASPDPTQSHLHRAPLTGGPSVALTTGAALHSAAFSRDHSVFTHHVAALEAVPNTLVCRNDGATIAELPSVAEAPPFIPRAEILKVGEGAGFYARVIRPRAFEAGKRYPVLVNVYGGPHANTVLAAMGSNLLNQWLADQGFIVVSLDGRGTPGRGRDWERAISRRLGSVPLEDQVAGLQALGKRFAELDLERVGIFGWSFGGYMSALAVLQRPDVYRGAVAGAPVTDWLDYDTHYTERYLGLPYTEGPAYDNASLLPRAGELRRPLLLIHGTVDDNVYFRHSLRLGEALFRAGKDFDLLPLPGFTHMVPDPVVSERLWSRIAQYFRDHL